MVGNRPVLLVVLIPCRFCLSFQLLVLLRRILNDQVLRLDLRGRALDHVFDNELSIAEFADAASLCLIFAWCLFRSEKPGLLHTFFATGLSAEVTVGVLEFFLILPRVFAGVASWCVLVVSLTNGLVHEEYSLKLIEDMLTLSNEENSTSFE